MFWTVLYIRFADTLYVELSTPPDSRKEHVWDPLAYLFSVSFPYFTFVFPLRTLDFCLVILWREYENMHLHRFKSLFFQDVCSINPFLHKYLFVKKISVNFLLKTLALQTCQKIYIWEKKRERKGFLDTFYRTLKRLYKN